MIISASYKTDIPTFYGEWFINRIRAGYCRMINPYNQKTYIVDLSQDEVDGLIFWTKNVGPFLKYLPEISVRGYPFIIQHTINGYPRTLEFSVVDAKKSIENMKVLNGDYGNKIAVWRYDTIVFSSVTPRDFHLRNFEFLARNLEGLTDEVVISFAQIYTKTKHNMDWAAKEYEFTWEDPEDVLKFTLASELAQISKSYNIQLSMCAQKQFIASGVVNAHCVDARRLSEISGKNIQAKQKGNRPDCGCFISRDIGEYDTCPHGCVYCYAVQNRKLAQSRFRFHNPDSEFLFTPAKYTPDEISNNDTDSTQLKMF